MDINSHYKVATRVILAGRLLLSDHQTPDKTAMTAPILTTKLFTPPPRLDAVPRARLTRQLNNCLGPGTGFLRKLTLVSAPAGFGKTTLVSNWLAESKLATAWLSLDARDADLTRAALAPYRLLEPVAKLSYGDEDSPNMLIEV